MDRELRVLEVRYDSRVLRSPPAHSQYTYATPSSRGFVLYLYALYAAFLLVSCLVETGVIPQRLLCSWGGPCF